MSGWRQGFSSVKLQAQLSVKACSAAINFSTLFFLLHVERFAYPTNRDIYSTHLFFHHFSLHHVRESMRTRRKQCQHHQCFQLMEQSNKQFQIQLDSSWCFYNKGSIANSNSYRHFELVSVTLGGKERGVNEVRDQLRQFLVRESIEGASFTKSPQRTNRLRRLW